jgi:hypothetical protein
MAYRGTVTRETATKFMGHGVLLTLSRNCLQAAIPTQGAVSVLPLDRYHGLRNDRLLAGLPFVRRRVSFSRDFVKQAVKAALWLATISGVRMEIG